MLAAAAAGLVALSFAQAWWNPIADPDVFWQLWAGRELLDGHVPRANTFSWTAPETPWVHHEPLVALGYAAAGLENSGRVRALVVSLTGLLLVSLAYRRECAWATLFGLCGALALVIYGRSERALTWGNLVLALLAYVLYRVDARHRWRMPAAVLLVVVWANVHGSFVIGILMLGLVHWSWGALAAVLCLCNPNGYQLYALLIGYGAGSEAQAFVHAAIPEWYPLDLGTALGWVRLAGWAGAGVLLWRARNVRMLVLWGAVGVLAIRHQRFFDVLGIALLPACVDALAVRLPARALRHPAPVLAALFAVIAVWAPRAQVDGQMYPQRLLAHLPAAARLWHEFHLGGWLGYHGRAVFWDPRNDCYPRAVLEDGLRIEKRRSGWLATLERWRVDTVLTADPELARALTRRAWHEVARDGGFVLLRNETRSAAK